MSIRQVQREQVIERLTAHLLAHGLARTSLRQLAAAAGVSDRMLLYYFTDKAEVLEQVLGRIADGFAAALDAALPAERAAPDALLLKAAHMVRAPEARPLVRLWVEIVIAASRGEPPYPALAARILESFLGWLEARLDCAEPAERREAAAMVLAMIDGMALFDLAGHSAVAEAGLRRIARHKQATPAD